MTFLDLLNDVQDRWDKNGLGELYHKNYVVQYCWDKSGGGFKDNTWDDFNPKDSVLTFMFRILYYVIESIRDKTGIPPRFGLGKSASDALLKEPLTADDKEYLYDNYENAAEWILVRDFWVARKRIDNPFPADNFNFLRRMYDIICNQYGASIKIEMEERDDKAPADWDSLLEERIDKLKEWIERLEKKQGMIAEDINRRITALEDERVRYDD